MKLCWHLYPFIAGFLFFAYNNWTWSGYTKFQNQEAPLDGEPLPYVPAGQPPQYGQAMSMGATDPAMGQGQVQPMGAPNPAMGLGYGQPTATSVMVKFFFTEFRSYSVSVLPYE